MIPSFSSADFGRPWVFVTRGRAENLTDYERGGAVLGQPFGPPPWVNWMLRYLNGQLVLSREDGSQSQVLETIAGITRVALTFDQNMSPVAAYEVGGNGFLRRVVPGTGVVTTNLGAVSNVCLTIDDCRPIGIADSDVILAYMRGGSLCCRVQRENYAERVLDTEPGGTLRVLGVCDGPRLQWRLA